MDSQNKFYQNYLKYTQCLNFKNTDPPSIPKIILNFNNTKVIDVKNQSQN